VLAGNYVFDNSAGSAALLGRLAKLAKAAGAPFLAGASPRILGCASLAESPDPRAWRPSDDEETRGWWEAVRRLPDARWLGLALPRFLLRLPYGRQTSETEAFDFEEMPGTPRHEAYLWGNAVFACVYLLGQAFSEYGWEFRPGAVRDVDGLPAHVYGENGETNLKPCAEVLLTEAAAEAILERGLMPLISIKGTDRVQLGRFQSIAEPLAPLAGRWA
jgi:type VI secretion system protein ImpC